MPWGPVIKAGKNRGKRRSKSGKLWTQRQIRAYKATGGFKRKPLKLGRLRKRR